MKLIKLPLIHCFVRGIPADREHEIKPSAKPLFLSEKLYTFVLKATMLAIPEDIPCEIRIDFGIQRGTQSC